MQKIITYVITILLISILTLACKITQQIYIMRFQTSGNYEFREEHKEKVRGKSQTIPNDTYTIEELLRKHTQGIMPPVGRSVYYEDDPNIDAPDITKRPDFDLVDVTEGQINLEQLIKQAEEEKLLEAKTLAKKEKDALEALKNENALMQKKLEKLELKKD